MASNADIAITCNKDFAFDAILQSKYSIHPFVRKCWRKEDPCKDVNEPEKTSDGLSCRMIRGKTVVTHFKMHLRNRKSESIERKVSEDPSFG